jgi:aerobic carbon-monoxide dehydrogenase medium subunit
MYSAPFTYIRPRSLDEALQFLADHADDTKVLAGGQSLIPLLKLRLVFPRFVMDIARVAELQGIREVADMIEVGALVRHVEIERSDALKGVLPLLPETAAGIGDLQVRNRGTIGGSLAHADAAADFTAAALALDAQMVIRSKGGERTVAAADFFVDLMTTALNADEILTSIRFPKNDVRRKLRLGSAYLKLNQQASGFGLAGAAALVAVDEQESISFARVAVTGVNGVPYRAAVTEAHLAGAKASAELMAAASSHAADGIDPISDIHGSSEYRRDMACVIARRALHTALQRAKHQG